MLLASNQARTSKTSALLGAPLDKAVGLAGSLLLHTPDGPSVLTLDAGVPCVKSWDIGL